MSSTTPPTSSLSTVVAIKQCAIPHRRRGHETGSASACAVATVRVSPFVERMRLTLIIASSTWSRVMAPRSSHATTSLVRARGKIGNCWPRPENVECAASAGQKVIRASPFTSFQMEEVLRTPAIELAPMTPAMWDMLRSVECYGGGYSRNARKNSRDTRAPRFHRDGGAPRR